MTIRSDQTRVHDVRALIAALDRRLLRVERDRERALERDAQGSSAALTPISERERSRSSNGTPTSSRETA
jgi:hypothetical protein